MGSEGVRSERLSRYCFRNFMELTYNYWPRNWSGELKIISFFYGLGTSLSDASLIKFHFNDNLIFFFFFNLMNI